MLKRLFQGSKLCRHFNFTLYIYFFYFYSLERQQPQARWGHSCVALQNKAIVWGGMQAILPEVHTSDQKTRVSSVIEVNTTIMSKFSS